MIHLSLHERIKGIEGIDVASSVFEYFFHEEEGGAISIVSSSSISIAIKKSMFHECLTEKIGGAIYATSLSTKLMILNNCFDTCSITIRKDGCYGNALNIQSSSQAGESQVNQTIFYFCGPKLGLSSDATVFFQRCLANFIYTNFTDCYSYCGPCTVGVSQHDTKLLYMQSNRGTSLHITCSFDSYNFEVEKSNMINWTQHTHESKSVIFHKGSGKSSFYNCAIFIAQSYYGIGPCNFDNCFGNLSGLISTSLTEFEIETVTFGIYCRGFVNLKDKLHSTMLPWEHLITLAMLIPLLHTSEFL